MNTLRTLVLVLALAAAVPAMAQVPLDPLDDHSAKRLDRMEQALKEIRAIVFQGRETGKPVVVEPADTDAQMQSLSQKIDDLQQSVTRLTGQLESAAHDVDEAHKEADALREENGALTARVAALEQKQAQSAAVTPPPVTGDGDAGQTPPPTPTDPAAVMAAAREAYNAGDLASAETGFHSVVEHAGDTPRGLEARYFLGKIMLRRGSFADAAQMDLVAVRQWPATLWAPDAALDLARAFVGMKRPHEACGILGQIDTHYPKAGAEVRAGAAEVGGAAGCSAG